MTEPHAARTISPKGMRRDHDGGDAEAADRGDADERQRAIGAQMIAMAWRSVTVADPALDRASKRYGNDRYPRYRPRHQRDSDHQQSGWKEA